MTQLRLQFESYMTLQRFSPKTKAAYINAVKGLAAFYRISPDKLSNEQVQAYLHYLIENRKLAWSSVNVALSGLCCFYRYCLKREDTALVIPRRPRQHQLPRILSTEEVYRIIHAVTNLKQRILLMTVYGAGLRVSEAVKLKPFHIERERKMIRVEQGKGRKDRYTLLPERLLQELEVYREKSRPLQWVFPGRREGNYLSIATAQKYYERAREKAGIEHGQGIHTLRHCFATHLLEQGADISIIKELLGHRSLKTTMNYLHLIKERTCLLKSPLDHLFPTINA